MWAAGLGPWCESVKEYMYILLCDNNADMYTEPKIPTILCNFKTSKNYE